ncbi:hypothetical protein [Haloarcula amylovorans]|uniref:hypothetical protein n=1 Tax=Haloarcula amylovorans TaxID=2562280 RepID=UPI001075ED5B|nr:hypothetical protein [Halomicroarcula amylolytica]
MTRRHGVLLVTCVVAVALVGLPAVAAQETVTPDEAATNGSGPGLGTQLTVFLQSSSAAADGTVENEMWKAGFERANGSQKSDRVTSRTGALEQRLDRLRTKNQRLQARYENDSVPRPAYVAQKSQLDARIKALRAAVNDTDEAAAEANVDTDRIQRLKENASELSGPEIAVTAREVGGGPPGNAGPPTDAGPRSENETRGGPPTDVRERANGSGPLTAVRNQANESAPPSSAQNQSNANGPPTDVRNRTNESAPRSNVQNRTNGSTQAQTLSNQSHDGPPVDAENASGRQGPPSAANSTDETETTDADSTETVTADTPEIETATANTEETERTTAAIETATVTESEPEDGSTDTEESTETTESDDGSAGGSGNGQRGDGQGGDSSNGDEAASGNGGAEPPEDPGN